MALLAANLGPGGGAAAGVLQPQSLAPGGQVLVAPLHQPDQGGKEGAALVGEPVLVASSTHAEEDISASPSDLIRRSAVEMAWLLRHGLGRSPSWRRCSWPVALAIPKRPLGCSASPHQSASATSSTTAYSSRCRIRARAPLRVPPDRKGRDLWAVGRGMLDAAVDRHSCSTRRHSVRIGHTRDGSGDRATRPLPAGSRGWREEVTGISR
jgi:hypothetical protein